MIERSIAFGPEDGLVGTLCLPARPAGGAAAVGLVLFNAGVVHRIGPHRLNVRLARVLAKRGIASIRFDLSGLGDSARPGAGHAFEKQAEADLACAMDVLGRQAGIAHFALFGFCSGGCHGYEAAAADPRVAGLLMYDTYIYRTPRSRLNNLRIRIRRRGLVAAAGSWATRHLGALLRRIGLSGALPAAARPRSSVGLFPTPTREAFAGRVRMLHGRGTLIGVMYSGESDDYNYPGQFEDAFRGLGIAGMVSHHFRPEMDHTAMALSEQAGLIARIAGWTEEVDRHCRHLRGDAARP